MKRFIISLSFIFIFVITAVSFDQWYMYRFAKRMNDGIDAVISTTDEKQLSEAVHRLNEQYRTCRPIVAQLVFANRLEEVETVLYKLNAYIEVGEVYEIHATAEELRSRISLISSADLYYRNHKNRYGIN